MDPLAHPIVSRFRLHRIHYKQMRYHAERFNHREVCGIVSGINGVSIRVFEIKNLANSPTRFLMEPTEQLKVFQHLERVKQHILAIYHSHPNQPSFPSTIDIQEAYYPNALNLIWSQINGYWMCQAYYIRNRKIKEIPIKII